MSQKKLSLLELSDIFRRGVGTGPEIDFDAPARADLVAKTRELAVRCTYLYHEFDPSHAINRCALENVSKTLQDMATILDKMDVKTARLPFASANPNGQWIKEQILSPEGAFHANGLERRFRLQRGDYTPIPTLSMFPVKQDCPTIFDEGVRGVADYQKPPESLDY